MELRDLEYFATVAEHGHLGRAAESLDLSQPALSKCLRRLERAMQTKLVRRTPKGVELTAVGAALRGHVDRLRLSMDDVVREAADLSHGRAGHLHIGVGAGVYDSFMALACSAMLGNAPKVTLLMTIGPNAELMATLRDGACDLVVSGIPHPSFQDIVQEPLYDDEFIVFAARNHRLAKARRVHLADLVPERWAQSASQDLVWRHVRRVFEDHGLPQPVVVVETKATAVRIESVALSDLVSYISKRNLQPFLQDLPLTQLPVKELAWTRSIGVSYRKNAYHSPAARRFMDILKSSARDLRPD
ncbi:MAG: LysR family transcriptional regulator [Burkholderiales bacterium]